MRRVTTPRVSHPVRRGTVLARAVAWRRGEGIGWRRQSRDPGDGEEEYRMLRGLRDGRRLGAVVVGAVLAAVMGVAAPAWGATVSADCPNTASRLSSPTSGETIELTGLCTAPDNSFPPLPSGATNLTIEGATSGDGFDGAGASGPALRNLTFENYIGTNNGAVNLSFGSGALPVIDHDRFMNNTDSVSAGVT